MSRKNPRAKNRSAKERQTEKKATVLGAGAKSKNPLLIMVSAVCAGILIFAGYFFFNRMGQPPQAVALAKEVTHPTALFDDGKARHFQLDAGNGITIRYFVLKSSDGVIRAAFDACDVCWRSGKGYYQEGDFMVCRNCGKRFASVKVNEVRGGCNPAPLERQVIGDQLVIRVKDILGGKGYFNFTNRG